MSVVPGTTAGRAAVLAILASGAIGFGVARWIAPGASSGPAASSESGKKILYYYDPMVPLEHYAKPGVSSMGMPTQPKYAGDESGGGPPTVNVDPGAEQNLGIRVVTATTGALAGALDVTGAIDFNQRDIAIVQARSTGFVQRVYHRAPGDVIAAGAPIADLLVPEWGGAEAEFRAVRRTGDRALTAAAGQRLRLLGIPAGQTGRRGLTTVRSPIGGVIQTLDARAGVTLAQGQTLAQINGLGTVWLNAAIPEAQAGQVRVGQSVTADLTAFPGEPFGGRVIAVLPTASTESRTLTVRIELANRGYRLRPGMFATVHLSNDARPALLVPSEAVIRTGKRVLVMLAEKKGHYRPAEVRIGRDAGGQTEILAGLGEGEKVVASGQFLLDSEASLSGIPARPIGGDGK